jgi:putative flavoprotein involved in K+ transport
MVNYFNDYVRRQGLRLGLGVTAARLGRDEDGWRIVTDGNAVTARAVVVATGNYHTPTVPRWPGAENFSGQLLHSADYRSAWPLSGRDVLVVGGQFRDRHSAAIERRRGAAGPDGDPQAAASGAALGGGSTR